MPKNKQQNMFFMYVKDFFDDMRKELKSERTVETYRESLNSFRIYILDKYAKKVDAITVDFVTDKIVREYTAWVARQGSVNTRNIRLTALKMYINYSSKKNVDFASLQISLGNLKHKTVHPKRNNWLDKDQILLLLEQPKPTKIGVRDRFIILFLFSTGARLNEMLAIKLKDIIIDGKYPYVRFTRECTKGNRPRIVPVSDETFIENFKYYCTLYHTNNDPEAYLFHTTIRGRQGRMSDDNVQRILKKYGDSARSLNKSLPSVHPHLIRHSYGAQLYRLGLSLPEIAKLLGHEDISTTEIYAEPDVEMAAEALKKMIGPEPPKKWTGLSEEEKAKLLGLK